MTNPRLPPVLYKYLAPDLTSVLSNLQLRFTPPSGLNDPLEALPRVMPPTRETLARHILPGEDLDELMARAGAYFADVGPGMIRHKLSKEYGVLCLSREATNHRLWAHYADGHRGFAIGLNSSHPWFHEWDPPLGATDAIQEVVYQVDPAVVVMRDGFYQVDHKLEARAMLFTKAQAWSDEAEWRLIRPLDRADHVGKARDGSDLHLFHFPLELVREVIFGERTEPGDVEAVRKAMEVSGLRVILHLTQLCRGVTIHVWNP